MEHEQEADRVHFHTYTLSSNKTRAFIIQGLDNKTNTGRIKAAFEAEHEIGLKEVYALRAPDHYT